MLNFKKNNVTISNDLWIIYLVIFATILTPSIRLGKLPGFRIEQVIVFFFFMYVFIKLALRKEKKHVNFNFIIFYTGFSFFIILSILIGSFKGMQIILNDFFEIYKIFIYIGIYLITITRIVSEEDKMNAIKVMIFCLLISLIVAVQQYFNVFNLNEKYVYIIAPTQFRTLVNNYPYPRVVGMTGNPNEYSVMPAIGAILSWSMYLITKKKEYILYVVLFIFGTLITLSRSGFVFMGSGILMFTFLYLFRSNLSIKHIIKGRINLNILRTIILAVIILTLLGFIIFNYLPEELTWRLMSGININEDSSFQARITNWEEHITYFKISPLAGLGPAKSIKYEHHVDNEWLLFLRQYGILGTVYIILVFTIPFFNSRDKVFKYIYFSILFGCSLYMIPSVIYNSFQLMPLIMILAALVSMRNSTI